MVARIGKGKKVKAKCPRCGQATCTVEPATTTHAWLIYHCYRCDLKFKLPRGWKARADERLQGSVREAQSQR